MLFDEKIVNILTKIRNNKKNIGYTNLLKDPSISVNQTTRIVKYLWEKDIVGIENKGRKKIVNLTDKGDEVFDLINKVSNLIK